METILISMRLEDVLAICAERDALKGHIDILEATNSGVEMLQDRVQELMGDKQELDAALDRSREAMYALHKANAELTREKEELDERLSATLDDIRILKRRHEYVCKDLTALHKQHEAVIEERNRYREEAYLFKFGEGEYTVMLTDIGPNKINMIKLMRMCRPGLGLKDAKDFVELSDHAPVVFKADLSRDGAVRLVQEIVSVGGSASVVGGDSPD